MKDLVCFCLGAILVCLTFAIVGALLSIGIQYLQDAWDKLTS